MPLPTAKATFELIMKITLKASRPVKIIISCLIFFVTLEIGLNLIAPIYNVVHPQPEAKKEENIVLILGESTSTDIITGNNRSWATQLSELHNSISETKFKYINFAAPGTTSSALLEKLNNFLKEEKPKLVISMMGVNDSPHFWYNEFSLVKNKDSKFSFKTIQLLKILFNYKRFQLSQGEEAAKSSAAAPVVSSTLDYPDFKKLASDLIKTPQDSPEYALLLKSIETFLASKTNLQKSQFYAALAHDTQPPFGEPLEKFVKSYEFIKLSVAADASVDQSLDIALHFAMALNRRGDCKKLVRTAQKQNATISNVSINRIMSCIPDETKFIERVLEKQKSPFVFESSETLPTVHNYQLVFDLLMGQDICWIAMGYPRQDLPDAATQFNGRAESNSKYFTLENKEAFEKYLQNNPYESLFMDRFASNFGHMTEKGASLIADNAFELLKKIKSQHLCGL